MSEQKLILLTFDYELFLGSRSGTVPNCLLTPTKQILAVLKKHGVKAVFFVDTIYLRQLSEVSRQYEKAAADYSNVKLQIQEIANAGHYVFHHIHPHWLDAKYLPEINQWNETDYSHFALSTLSPQQRQHVFDLSLAVLNELLKTANILGYRAGGLYAQPFEQLADDFKRSGIRYDFSVLPGFKSDMGNYGFNFSDITDCNPYTFQAPAAAWKEFPISSIVVEGLSKVINGIWFRIVSRRASSKKYGDGTGSRNRISSAALGNRFRAQETLSVELLNEIKIRLYFKYIRQHDYTHFISHPKLISENQLLLLDHLLSKLISQYQVEFDFMLF